MKLVFPPWGFSQTPPLRCLISPSPRQNLRSSLFGSPCQWDLSEPSFLCLRPQSHALCPRWLPCSCHPSYSRYPLSNPWPWPSASISPAFCRSDSPGLSWYHWKNADKAQKCRARVPGRETSCPGGGCFHMACRFYRFFSSISSGQGFFPLVSGGLRCLRLCFFLAPVSSSTSGVKLFTGDRSSLSCSGSRIIPLCFGTCSFEWLFQLAPVSLPILGAGF